MKKNNGQLEKILGYFFPRAREKRDLALKLLKEIRDRQRRGNPYRAEEWEEWINKYEVSQGQYSSALKKLRDEKIIRKEKGCFYLSDELVMEIIQDWLVFKE